MTQKTIRYACLTVMSAVSVGILAGCSTMLGSSAQNPSSQPETSATTPATAPWDDPSTPTVVIEFEADGETQTVMGEIPDGLRSCDEDGMSTIAGTSSGSTFGVSFKVQDGESTHVGVWAVEENYAVQVLAEGEVETTPLADGGTNYSTIGATGTVSVLPRDPEKTSIGEYDFQGFEPQEATASFTVNCP